MSWLIISSFLIGEGVSSSVKILVLILVLELVLSVEVRERKKSTRKQKKRVNLLTLGLRLLLKSALLNQPWTVVQFKQWLKCSETSYRVTQVLWGVPFCSNSTWTTSCWASGANYLLYHFLRQSSGFNSSFPALYRGNSWFWEGHFSFMIFFICLAKHCACCVGNKPAVIITIRGLIGRVVDFIIYPGSFIYCIYIYIYIYFSGQNFDIMHNRRQRKNTDGYAELPQKGTFLDTQTQTEIRKQIYIYTPTQTLTGIRLFTTQTRNRRNLTQRRKRWAAHTDTMTQRWGLETVSTVSDTDAMAEWQM
jgi:hypothetical protein